MWKVPEMMGHAHQTGLDPIQGGSPSDMEAQTQAFRHKNEYDKYF